MHTKTNSLLKLCSVLPALLVMPAMADIPEGYVATTEQSISTPMDIIGKTYENNYVRSKEGTAVEKQNLSYLFFAHKGEVSNISKSVFNNNNTEVGGALATTGGNGNQSAVVVSNTTFTANSALYDAGAIGNYGFLIIGEGVRFENNVSVNGIETVNYMGGGALGLGSWSKTVIDEDTEFTGNYSGTYGGAIATRRSENGDNHVAILDVKGDFELNEAKYRGGAIYNTFYNGLTEGTGVTVDADFVGNHAGQYGGAIYNDGTLDLYEIEELRSGAVMTVNDSEFEYNTAGDKGGAIYNTGKMTINDSELKNNIAGISGGAIYNLGTLTVKNSEFVGNKSMNGTGDGGAIYSNTGALTLINTDFKNNSAKENAEKDYGYGGAIFAQGGTLTIQGEQDDYAEFIGNHGLTAGAVYVSKSVASTTIENVLFKENWASDIGALGIFGKDTKLTNLHFVGNYTTGEFAESNDGGGALFFGAVSATDLSGVLSDSMFESNTSASRGGAISTRTFSRGDNKDAYLDITSTNFKYNNAATNGGAIDNFFYHSATNADAVYVSDADFDINSAKNGGAIYNHGSTSEQNINLDHDQFAAIELNNVSFTGNTATEQGGAIYNELNGKVFLSGTNTFTGNKADGIANDIYNLGELAVISGETTIDGGIDGTGSLTIAKDAVLNIGTATIAQGNIDVAGTINASVLNQESFAQILGNVTGSGTLALSLASAGTYQVFDNLNDLNITYGASYIVEKDGSNLIVSTKSADALAADTGISTNTAGVVAILANSDSKAMQQVSLMVQDALNQGDVEVVEQELAKANPEVKPVAQSVATSVQGQVLSVASGRMSAVGGATTGRSGGDVTAAGAWAQGMFNKSKMSDKFHGYTRGFALGGDTQLNNSLTMGVGYAFSNTDVHSGGRTMDVETNSVFVYGQYKPSQWYVNGTISYAESEYSEDAGTVFGVYNNSSEYEVKSYGAQLMGGYDFAFGLSPVAGLRYLHVAQEEYTNGLGLNVQASDTDYMMGVLGVNYAFAIETEGVFQIRPELRAAMTYDFIYDDAVTTVVMPGAPSYYVYGDRLSRIGGEFGIGLTMNYRDLDVSLNYDIEVREDYTSQTGMLKFRYDF